MAKDFIKAMEGHPHFKMVDKMQFVLDQMSDEEWEQMYNSIKERLVLYKRNKNNSFDYNNPIFEAHWATINGDPEVGSTLKKLIGKEVVKALN